MNMKEDLDEYDRQEKIYLTRKGSKMVRAKFKCDECKDGNVRLSPVYTGSEENEKFFQATPGGSIQLSIVNPQAVEYFKVGEEYYIDFVNAKGPF